MPLPIYSCPPPSPSRIYIHHPTVVLSLKTGDRGQHKSRASSGAALMGRLSLSPFPCSSSFTLCLSCRCRAGHLLLSSSPTHKGICPGSWCSTNLLWNARRHFSSLPISPTLLCLSYCISSIRLNRAALDRILRLFSRSQRSFKRFPFLFVI